MQDFGSSEYIPTRSTKTAPKVAYNPMQFVKTGPTKLAMTAQEQLKKVEEVKKIREKKKDDAEDWQSVNQSWHFQDRHCRRSIENQLKINWPRLFDRIWKDGNRVDGRDKNTSSNE